MPIKDKKSPEIKAKVIEMLGNGINQKEIAKMVGASISYVEKRKTEAFGKGVFYKKKDVINMRPKKEKIAKTPKAKIGSATPIKRFAPFVGRKGKEPIAPIADGCLDYQKHGSPF